MRYLFSLLFCLFINVAFGQSSLLWEISGKGLKKSSFLYGTMHVKDERVFRFGDSVMVKFNQCKVYAGELAMDQISPSDAINMMMMPKDTTLKMLLDKEDYDFVKKKVEEKIGPMAPLVDRIKPLFSSVLVTEMSTKENKEINPDSTQSLDVYLQKIAKKKGMKVIGIETPQEQIAAIDKLSLKQQAQMLLSSLKDSLKTDHVMENMYDLYLNQDMDGMEKLMHDSEMPDLFSEAILTKRNYVMADRISKVIKKSPTFIGIGAAHLAGEEGLISLLRKKGFTVKPVISKYTGKAEVKKELEFPFADPQLIYDPSGWVGVKSAQGNFQLSFPAKPEIQRIESVENEPYTISVFALEPKTDNLFTLNYYLRNRNDSISGIFFDKLIQDFKNSGFKLVSDNKNTIQGIPSLEVEMVRYGKYIRMNYCFLSEIIVETAVIADKDEIRSAVSEQFFNSIKFLR